MILIASAVTVAPRVMSILEIDAGDGWLDRYDLGLPVGDLPDFEDMWSGIDDIPEIPVFNQPPTTQRPWWKTLITNNIPQNDADHIEEISDQGLE